MVAYNYNTEVVRIRGEESYETIEAYTGYCNGLGIAGTEKMVWSPDPLYVLNIDELKIKKSDEVFHLDWKLESVNKELLLCNRGERTGICDISYRVCKWIV